MFLYHHLGLGDSIICNGMVRHFSKTNKLSIFSKSHNYDTIKFMYRDSDRITVIPINGSDKEVMEYLSKIHVPFKEKFLFNTLKVGFENLWSNHNQPNKKWYSPSFGFDRRFYEIINLDFSIRWNEFKVVRDNERERKLFDKFNLEDKKFIFVHDDARFKINRTSLSKDFIIVEPIPGLTSNIFDYCYIIEKAQEVHTIESSFQFMIDSLELNKNNFVHRYARPLTEGEKPMYRTVKKIFS